MKPPGARRWFASFTEENKRHAFVRDFASLPRGRFALVEKEVFPRERASAPEMPHADRVVARPLSIRKPRDPEWREGKSTGASAAAPSATQDHAAQTSVQMLTSQF